MEDKFELTQEQNIFFAKRNIDKTAASEELTSKFRASYYIIGSKSKAVGSPRRLSIIAFPLGKGDRLRWMR